MGDALIRLTHLPAPKDFEKTKKAQGGSFELSSEEKRRKPYLLSVFSVSRTTPRQCWEIVGCKGKQYLCLRTSVEFLRDLPDLGAIWDRLDLYEPPPENLDKPGVNGHAGITGLGPDVPSKVRRTLRTLLADKADAQIMRCVPRVDE